MLLGSAAARSSCSKLPAAGTWPRQHAWRRRRHPSARQARAAGTLSAPGYPPGPASPAPRLLVIPAVEGQGELPKPAADAHCQGVDPVCDRVADAAEGVRQGLQAAVPAGRLQQGSGSGDKAAVRCRATHSLCSKSCGDLAPSTPAERQAAARMPHACCMPAATPRRCWPAHLALGVGIGACAAARRCRCQRRADAASELEGGARRETAGWEPPATAAAERE
jgi:hypothetical protein